MLYLTCTTMTSIDFAHYGVSRAKDWVSVKCGTMTKRDCDLILPFDLSALDNVLVYSCALIYS